MHNILKKLSQWLLLIIILIILACAIYFHLYDYLSLTALKNYHATLKYWTSHHYMISVIVFMLVYVVAAAISIPGALFLTISAGFLFGPWGTIYVVISATIGATILFLAIRTSLGATLADKLSGWVFKMKKGFQENAFNYLLVLRLIPIFPFWIINAVSGLLEVPIKTFVLATLIGIIPGTFVYVLVGNGLNTILAKNQVVNLHIIFTPSILLPLIGLALLAILPVLYQKFVKKKSD